MEGEECPACKRVEKSEIKQTKVISGFPGVGKSFNYNKENNDLVALDSDSSKFSWISEGVRHPDFPNNYMEHIKDNIGKADIIFVSSHDNVRQALQDSNIEYTLVYPAIELKDEYIERYKARGDNEGFINFIGDNWKEFITNIEKESFPKLIKLEPGQYLSNIL